MQTEGILASSPPTIHMMRTSSQVGNFVPARKAFEVADGADGIRIDAVCGEVRT